MTPAECARRVVAGTDESIIAKMRTVLTEGSEEEKVKFAIPFIEPMLTRSDNHFKVNKSNVGSLRLLNRSDVSLRENKYHLALKTLNKALSFAKEKEIIKKIESQRQLVLAKSGLTGEIKLKTAACAETADNEEREKDACFKRTSDLPKLHMGANGEIGAFCAAVELQHSEELGRHLIALQHIPPGCVIGVELPFANVLHSSCKYSHCSECLTKTHFLIPCQHCTQAMYCSEKCRASAWAAHHAFECQIAGQLQTAGLSPVDVLAVRVLSLFKPDKILQCQTGDNPNPRCAGFSPKGKSESDSLHAFMHTHCNPRGWTFEETLTQLVTALVILRICELDKHPQWIALAAFVLRCLQRIPLISHEISERCTCNGPKLSDHGIALGIFSAFSLVNHSCDQNVVKQNLGQHSIMRSIRLIRKGEQIVDSYGPHFIADSIRVRTKVLNSQFRFDCQCEACDKDWPMQGKLPWSLQVDVGERAKEAVRVYLERGRVRPEWRGNVERAIEVFDSKGKRMCQFYFVLQQILKVLYASSNFVFCKCDAK